MLMLLLTGNLKEQDELFFSFPGFRRRVDSSSGLKMKI
jgi:hypothetical protein